MWEFLKGRIFVFASRAGAVLAPKCVDFAELWSNRGPDRPHFVPVDIGQHSPDLGQFDRARPTSAELAIGPKFGHIWAEPDQSWTNVGSSSTKFGSVATQVGANIVPDSIEV